MAAGNAGGASAPLARLQGIKGWQTGVIQADGKRWVTFTLEWLDEDLEPVAVTFDFRDAQAIAKTLAYSAGQAEMRDIGDSN
jgi:hypothetical protein